MTGLIKFRNILLWVFVVFILLAVIGIRIDAPFAIIFTAPAFYYLIILLILILFIFTSQTRRRKFIFGSLSVIFGIIGGIIVFAAAMGGGLYSGYEKIAILNYKNSEIVAYQINSGATVDFTINLVEQKKILPRIYWQKKLDSVYHGHYVNLSLENDTVTAIYNPDSDSAIKKTYDLK